MTVQIQALVLIRSATAPEIKAAVMIAKVNWNIAKDSNGMVPVVSPMVSCSPMKSSPPMTPTPVSDPNASENP